MQVTDGVAGDQTWSAPVFFKVRGAGVGFMLGYSNVESMVIIDTQAAMDVFIKNEVLGTHFNPPSKQSF